MKEHPYTLLNHPVDVSRSFSNLENTMFLPVKLGSFNAAKAKGDILWGRSYWFGSRNSCIDCRIRTDATVRCHKRRAF